MRVESLIAGGLIAVAGLASAKSSPANRTARVVDTVFVKQPIDYAEVARRVAELNAQQGPTTIDGDLIVKGRIGVGGAPEPKTNYPITVHGAGDARMLFISNEALNDGQRVGTQHRHVGAIGVSHDGGLRMDHPVLPPDRRIGRRLHRDWSTEGTF